MKSWMIRTLHDFLGLLSGEGRNGIPGGLVVFDVRTKLIHDKYGNQWCLSCKCQACGARRSILLPIRRMAMHVERTHAGK